MDLKDFNVVEKSGEARTMPIRHPVTNKPLVEDDGTPWELQLIGQDSREFTKRQHALAQKRIDDGTIVPGKRTKIDLEEIQDEAIDLLVLCTKGWKGIKLDGASLPFTPENCKMLYTQYPWIKEQADQFIANRANFLGN